MKNDDVLTEELLRLARDKDPLSDPRWEKLADGSLTEEEHEELRALARASDLGKDAYEAFRPLEPEAVDRITDSVLASLAENRGAPVRRRRTFAIAVAACVVAVPAAAVYVLSLRAPASVPAYEISVTGDEQELRSPGKSPMEVHTLGPASRLQVILRPASHVDGPIAVRVLAVPGSGAPTEWDPSAEISSDGAARLPLTRAAFAGLPPGPCEVFLAVGRPDALPKDVAAMREAARRSGDSPGAPLRVVHLRLLLHDGARP